MRLTGENERQNIIQWIEQVEIATRAKRDAVERFDDTREEWADKEGTDEDLYASERNASKMVREAAFNDCLHGLNQEVQSTLDEIDEDTPMDELRDTANRLFSRGIGQRLDRLTTRLADATGHEARGLERAANQLQEVQNTFLHRLSDWQL
jgi:hypothetical protein